MHRTEGQGSTKTIASIGQDDATTNNQNALREENAVSAQGLLFPEGIKN
jgi:hypothetical protein